MVTGKGLVWLGLGFGWGSSWLDFGLGGREEITKIYKLEVGKWEFHLCYTMHPKDGR